MKFYSLFVTTIAGMITISPATADMTGNQIIDYFEKLGNTKTNIIVSRTKIYKPFNVEAYFEFIVTPLGKELAETGNDSIDVLFENGTKIRMLPVAVGWFTLKSPDFLPDSNAALAYFKINGVSGAGFIAKAENDYLFISAFKTRKITSLKGQLGVSFDDIFVPFDKIEFDLPKKFEIKK
jgi:hypothetical protein